MFLIRFAGFLSVCKIYKCWWQQTIVVVLFTLSNRALYPVIHVTASDLQSYNESMKTKQNKGTITQSTFQKKIEEGHCKEVRRSTCHIMVTVIDHLFLRSKLH